MKLYQITVKGKPLCDPIGIALKNAFSHAMDGVVVGFKCEEVPEKPVLRLVEGGRK